MEANNTKKKRDQRDKIAALSSDLLNRSAHFLHDMAKVVTRRNNHLLLSIHNSFAGLTLGFLSKVFATVPERSEPTSAGRAFRIEPSCSGGARYIVYH
eukprot:scaffold10576_cov84-Cylindrotheca_fusiformis.AAC.5